MYYIKRATVQDVTRTFVLNREALNEFFRLDLRERDDEAFVRLRYGLGGQTHQVRIVLKQDPRIFIDRFNLLPGDLVVFEKSTDSGYDVSYLKEGNPLYRLFCPLLNRYGYAILRNLP